MALSRTTFADLRWSAMSGESNTGVPLGAWLADLSDAGLIRLLELRPDLAQPPPASIAALAARATARQSVKAAGDELDFLQLGVLDALLVLQADTTPVPVAKLVGLLGNRTSEKQVLATLDGLRERALVWGADRVRVPAEAGSALPWYAGQATLEEPFAGDLAAALEGLDGSQRDLLERLRMGSPIGRTRDAAPGAPSDRPVPRLLAAGLLRQVDDETVILPRHVAQALRGDEPGPVSLTAPDPVVRTSAAKVVDASAAGAVIDLLREIDVILELLSTTPVPELRTGGLGVREAKRLAKLTGIDERRLGLILEVAAGAGLIASGEPDPEPDDGLGTYWAPTVAADRFVETTPAGRWSMLARAWLELPCRPSLIGTRGPDGKPYAALSDSLYSTAAPLDRRLLLGLLAELPTGGGVDAASAARALIWLRPRWASRLQPGPLGDVLDEAHALGFVGLGALSSPGRLLLVGDSTAAEAMAKVLPAPIDHFLVQADLTVVVPGPLQRELSDRLSAVASVESAGAAMVYRVSDASIRHALDTGHTVSDLHSLFEKHSKTPVPQALTYLIDDVARRHGQLRVGMASSFIRCEDPSLLAQAVSAPPVAVLDMRTLAPTVAVSQAPISAVLAALRSAGFAPAAEDASGAIVDIRRRGARVPATQLRRPFRPMPVPGPDTLAAVVGVLRKVGSSSSPSGGRVDPAVAMALLHQAAVQHQDVLMGYVDAAGVATQRVVSPISVHGGQLMAWDAAQGRIREFAVHRVTSVVAAQPG